MNKSFFANRPLAFSLLLSIAIATTEVPMWISLFAFALMIWRFVFERWNIYKLSPKITPLFGVVIFVLVYLQYKTILGQEESTTVLLGLVSISILNYKTDRDSLFLVLMGFLMVVIKSIFSLDFVWTIPAILSFFGLWLSLLTNPRLNKVKYMGQMALRSLPAFVILFIFFPRLVIFQSKQSQKVIAQSGFNEDLNPGRFGEITLQNQIVFRADFKNSPMSSEELYWRGAVLNISKGFSWQKGIVERAKTNQFGEREGSISYRIILEPSNLKNVFVLDTPVAVRTASSPIVEQQYRNFALAEVQSQQVQFEALAAFNSTEADSDDPTDLRKYLTIPDLPPRTKLLVQDIKAKNLSPKERLDFLKKFFREKGFLYTLNPGRYPGDLDEFLFERKKGFCEHFAAAFGTLARALDIPSRVVLGYQGGIYNSLGNFWKISQKDAHAWVEVGLNGAWIRMDPTGWVAPLRLSLGGENYFSLSEYEQILYSKDRDWKRPENFRDLFVEFKFAFENLNYYWTVLLLNYDMQAQLEYLKKLKSSGMVGGLIALSLLVLLVYSRSKFQPEVLKRHAMFQLIIKIEDWARAQGLQFAENQTPLQILKEIGSKFPGLSALMQKMALNYVQVAYRNDGTEVPIESLHKDWKEASRRVLKT